MSFTRQQFLLLLALAAAPGCARRAEGGQRIGFVVKQPEEPWFQNEWKFADQAAQEHGFSVIKIGAPDGDRVLTAIDNLAAKGAGGFVICAPDPRLGAAIQQRAGVHGLKVMSVDDRLVGTNGEPIESIPHVGISATKIGQLAGQTAATEATRRGWNLQQVGLLRLSFDSLQTAKERTEGARDALMRAGLPRENVFDAPQRTTDTEGGFNAANPVLTRQGAVRRWAIVGMNDEAVLGGVRASEGLGLKAEEVIGVGIGGSGTADAEFTKAQPTGLFASILLSPKRHGYDTTLAMYRWVKEGVRPAALVFTDGAVMTRENYKQLLAEQQV